jgi:hypothetical protein
MLLAILATAPLTAAEIIHVPGDVGTLQQAISLVSDGGIIEMAPGTYPVPHGGVLFGGQAKSFTVRAPVGGRAVLDHGAALPAHALLETYSVLTGFPPPHRAPANVVVAWLEDRFEAILPSPSVPDQRDLVRRLASLGRTGGAIYDAIIGLSAQRAGATLLTADRRALQVYEALGVPFQLL